VERVVARSVVADRKRAAVQDVGDPYLLYWRRERRRLNQFTPETLAALSGYFLLDCFTALAGTAGETFCLDSLRQHATVQSNGPRVMKLSLRVWAKTDLDQLVSKFARYYILNLPCLAIVALRAAAWIASLILKSKASLAPRTFA
jgi:hypothetical protein